MTPSHWPLSPQSSRAPRCVSWLCCHECVCTAPSSPTPPHPHTLTPACWPATRSLFSGRGPSQRSAECSVRSAPGPLGRCRNGADGQQCGAAGARGRCAAHAGGGCQQGELSTHRCSSWLTTLLQLICACLSSCLCVCLCHFLSDCLSARLIAPHAGGCLGAAASASCAAATAAAFVCLACRRPQPPVCSYLHMPTAAEQGSGRLSAAVHICTRPSTPA